MVQSIHRFVIKPLDGKQYNDVQQIGDVEFITTTSVENHRDVNRRAIVLEVPLTYKGNIKKGDEVIVQQNIFRIGYNNDGAVLQSENYLKDGLFYADPELIYLVKKEDGYHSVDESVFVSPVEIEDEWLGKMNDPHIGIVRYNNPMLERVGVKKGDKITFRKNCEHEFVIDGEKLYRMHFRRIMGVLN